MEEIWKDIRGYEGKYQVSNLGRVKSLERSGGNGRVLDKKVLKHFTDKGGYETVNLWKDGKKKLYKVHRLVIETFNPVPHMTKMDCNHIDENKSNNHIDNLNWLTRRENLNYGSHNNRIAKAHYKPIYCVELDRIFEGISVAAREFGNSRSNIWRVLDKPDRTACGFHWRYADN